MSAGFRKSFLGFNCDDVLHYIEKINKDFSEKEQLNADKIEELEGECAALQGYNAELLKKQEELKSALTEYERRSAEIDALSEKIGKLYLVSQANAKAIIDNANESSKIALEEVSKNISALENAHLSFEDMANLAVSSSAVFAGELEDLQKSLIKTKLSIKENKAEIEACTTAVSAITKTE